MSSRCVLIFHMFCICNECNKEPWNYHFGTQSVMNKLTNGITSYLHRYGMGEKFRKIRIFFTLDSYGMNNRK